MSLDNKEKRESRDIESSRFREEIHSVPVRAGKRTYFFDVKATRKDELYLTITESKKRFDRDGNSYFEKHKIFLYKEDFEKFSDGLRDVLSFIDDNQPLVAEMDEMYEPEAVTAEYSNVDFDDLAR
ncbi:MAG: DUF3276 family protein [Prolixibacteraceae bacterium]|jgi:hypothetical protein|nr:DUF3276 family protein [Prolixibacteraceae bacterium]